MKPDAIAAAETARAATRPRFARWALWDGLAGTARQFRLAWITIPVGAKGKFAFTIGVGFVLCSILTAGLTLLAKWRAPHGLAAWDERVLRGMDARDTLSIQEAIIAESFGNMAYMIPLVALCAIVAARRRRPLLAIAFVAAYVLARGIVWVGWLLWNRDRPRFILDGKAAPPLHSYPSGHIVLALSAWGILVYLWIRASKSWPERVLAAALLVGLVALTGVARVRLGAHWPSDVIAGFIIGLAWLAVVVRALHQAGDRA
jgi:membrane-associated phospholipid phosphatase